MTELALHAEMALGVGVMIVDERLYVGRDVPVELVSVLTPDIDACRRVLEPACGALTLQRGPIYVAEQIAAVDTHATIVRSTERVDHLRVLNPGNWEAGEWSDLLDGTLGPWTAALVDGRVASIAHTPRAMTPRAAECGVWTDARSRGRGYATATTAAWIDLLRPSGRVLFYATDDGNLASQRVAKRLGLRELGVATTLERPRTSNVHPLTTGR